MGYFEWAKKRFAHVHFLLAWFLLQGSTGCPCPESHFYTSRCLAIWARTHVLGGMAVVFAHACKNCSLRLRFQGFPLALQYCLHRQKEILANLFEPFVCERRRWNQELFFSSWGGTIVQSLKNCFGFLTIAKRQLALWDGPHDANTHWVRSYE